MAVPGIKIYKNGEELVTTVGLQGVGISSIEQTTTSTVSGGENIITVTLSNGETSTFSVYNGAAGSGDGSSSGTGSDGVGIASITQTTTSTESGGANVITITLTDGTSSTFTIYNGAQGETGSSYEVTSADYEAIAEEVYNTYMINAEEVEY